MNVMRVLVTEPGTSRAFPLRTVFLVSPAASSSATSMATSSTPEFAARLLQPLPKRPQVPASFARRRGRQQRVAPACAIGGTRARRRRQRPTTGAEAKASGAIRSAGIARRATLLEKAIQRGRSTLGGQRCLPMPPTSNCGVGACALNNHY